MTNFATYKWDEVLGGVYSCTAAACNTPQCRFYEPHPETLDSEREACYYYGIEIDFTNKAHPTTCHSVHAQHNAMTNYLRQEAVS
jgi:hypothetical protein